MTMLLLFLSLAFAQPTITAAEAWVSETAAGGTAVAGLTINNPTAYDIYVDAVTSDAAEKSELRDGDKAVKVITVPSFGFVELTAAGPHVVLMDLKRALKAGENITLTLTTDGGATVVTTAVVKSLP
jgi:copper(I)-binding protein